MSNVFHPSLRAKHRQFKTKECITWSVHSVPLCPQQWMSLRWPQHDEFIRERSKTQLTLTAGVFQNPLIPKSYREVFIFTSKHSEKFNACLSGTGFLDLGVGSYRAPLEMSTVEIMNHENQALVKDLRPSVTTRQTLDWRWSCGHRIACPALLNNHVISNV